MRVFLSIAASLALGLSACHKAPHSSGAKPPPVVTVRVETIEVKPHPVTEEVIGTVRAKIRAAVEAKVSGRITRMAVDLGQPVEKEILSLRSMRRRSRRDWIKRSLPGSRRARI